MGLARTLDPPYQSGGLTSGNGGGRGFPVGLARTLDPPYEFDPIHGHDMDGPAAHVVRCSCDPGPNGDGGQTVVDHFRLFPFREDVRWNYAVHEQTRSKASRLPATAKKFDPLEHGIADRKAAGNQQIVRPSHAEDPMRVGALSRSIAPLTARR